MSTFAEGAAAIGVGVRKHPPPPSGLLEGLSSEPRERVALFELGTLDLMRRAGAETEGVAPLEPCPPETRRVARAADALAQAFALKAELAVLEWADAAAQAGFVAPPEALPLLLGLPRASRERIRPVLGERGLWLAGLMDVEIEPLVAEPIALDDWDALDWKARAAGIATLAASLSPDDEPTLLRALEDRRAEVREAAVELLVRLPDSPPNRQLLSLAETHVVVRRSLRKTTIEVTLPDGESLPKWLPRPTARPGMGPGAHALRDVLRLVPPTAWGSSPDELLSLARKSDETDTLAEGWGEAALRFHCQEWIDALFRHPNLAPNYNGRYAHRASEAEFDAEVIPRLLRRGSGTMTVYGLLLLRQRPFSPRLSQAVVEAARHGEGHASYIDDLGYGLDFSALPLLDAPWRENSAPERLRLRWHTILELRARLLDSLR